MSKETILILNKERRDSTHLKTFLEKEKYIVLPVNTIDRLLTNFQEFEVSGVIVDLNVDRLYPVRNNAPLLCSGVTFQNNSRFRPVGGSTPEGGVQCPVEIFNGVSLFEIIKKIRERLPELYVMMIADGRIGEKEHQKVIETGVDDFFVKPMPYEKILFHLQSGLKQRKKYLQKRAES
jgi:DNA-binding response OmpR family regulator